MAEALVRKGREWWATEDGRYEVVGTREPLGAWSYEVYENYRGARLGRCVGLPTLERCREVIAERRQREAA